VNRVDPVLDLDFDKNPPMTGLPNDHFSIRWTALLTAPEAGAYTFYAVVNDGVRLFIDNQVVIDSWINASERTVSGSITLEQGRTYPLKVEYYEYTGPAIIQLSWATPSLPKQLLVPPHVRAN
jgi:hypothetical protein